MDQSSLKVEEILVTSKKKKLYPCLLSKYFFKESQASGTATMKAKDDVASIKKSMLYSSAHRRCNLLEVHIPAAKIVILLVLR